MITATFTKMMIMTLTVMIKNNAMIRNERKKYDKIVNYWLNQRGNKAEIRIIRIMMIIIILMINNGTI